MALVQFIFLQVRESSRYNLSMMENYGTDGRTTINFAVNGTNTYVVTAVAMGAGGLQHKSMDVTVYASFRPTEEFVKEINNNSSRF